MEEVTETSARLIQEKIAGPRRDFVGYGSRVPRVHWPKGEQVAVNIVVNYEEGAEYSIPDGDSRNERVGELPDGVSSEWRDLRIESVHEYGSRAGVWRLMRMFDELQIDVTFFACAVALERNPQVADALRDSNHEVASHGWRWSEHWLQNREDERLRLKAAVQSISETCGRRPRGWYSRTMPSVHTRELVVEEGGFRYDADAYNDDLPYFVDVLGRQHLVVPYTAVTNDMRFATQGYSNPHDFFETCKSSFDYLWDEGATHPRMMSIGLHPRLIGQPGRAHVLRSFIEYALDKGGVWFARRIDIADHWWEHHDEFRP